MIKKRGSVPVLGILIGLVLLVAVIHSAFHIITYGTSIPGFYPQGISGFSVGKLNLGDDFKAKYSAFSLPSKIILGSEWLLVLILVGTGIMREKISLRRDSADIQIKYKSDPSKVKTDLDVLYSLLQERKKINLSTIERLFKANRETVLEWADILEAGNLAILHYPKFGEAELFLDESAK